MLTTFSVNRNSETAGLRWQTLHIDLVRNYLFNFEKQPFLSYWPREIDWIQAGKNFVWVIGTYYEYIHGDTIVRKGIGLIVAWNNMIRCSQLNALFYRRSCDRLSPSPGAF